MQYDGEAVPSTDEEQKQNANEVITIDYPTELIPDEYQHEDGSNGQIYIVRDRNAEPMANKLIDSLKFHDFAISTENLLVMDEVDEIVQKLETLAATDFKENTTCLLVVVIAANVLFKRLLSPDKAKKIWSPFISNSTLKYKPKIFMFFEYEEEAKVMTDSRSVPSYQYDIPSEADVLIVHQKSKEINMEKGSYGFLTEFTANIKQFGGRDDIISLITRSRKEYRALIISTLRKKFYLSPSSFREHYFDILGNGDELLSEFENLINRMEQANKNKLSHLEKNRFLTGQSGKRTQVVTDGPSITNRSVKDAPSRRSPRIKAVTRKETPRKGTWKP